MPAASAPTRRLVQSVFAAPFFVLGFVGAAVWSAAVFCGAAVMTGVDAARERWKRAR